MNTSGSDCTLGVDYSQLGVVEAVEILSSRIVFPSFLPNSSLSLVEVQEEGVSAQLGGELQ